MVSISHEVLVELFKNRPALASELLSEVLQIPQPRFTSATQESAQLNDIQPAEYSADLVICLRHKKKIIRVIIVEVQLGIDLDKRLAWPAYVANARRKYGCPVDLLIIAPDANVARWCAHPIELGPPGFVLRPPVVHKKLIPVVTDAAEAKKRIELGMLSVMAHGHTKMGAQVAQALIPAISGLGSTTAGFYYDIMLDSLNEAARRALEEMMKGYEYRSDFAKKYVAQGVKKGMKKGREEGRAQEAAHALLTVLRLRGIALSDAEQKEILAQKDPEVLERWLERAVLANSLADVFDGVSH